MRIGSQGEVIKFLGFGVFECFGVFERSCVRWRCGGSLLGIRERLECFWVLEYLSVLECLTGVVLSGGMVCQYWDLGRGYKVFGYLDFGVFKCFGVFERSVGIGPKREVIKFFWVFGFSSI